MEEQSKIGAAEGPTQDSEVFSLCSILVCFVSVLWTVSMRVWTGVPWRCLQKEPRNLRAPGGSLTQFGWGGGEIKVRRL